MIYEMSHTFESIEVITAGKELMSCEIETQKPLQRDNQIMSQHKLIRLKARVHAMVKTYHTKLPNSTLEATPKKSQESHSSLTNDNEPYFKD